MIIFVNGQKKEFNDNSTLAYIITELSLDDKVMAAAVNMEIVKQKEWNLYFLKDGDKLELLDFVGGG